ncbi:MAG: hypothetical protein WCK09_10580 [Bacteroidota bacterium]
MKNQTLFTERIQSSLMATAKIRKQLFFNLFVALLLVSLVDCKKKVSPITCNLVAASNQPSVPMNITYTAVRTGDGVISSLTYVSETGTVTVTNPNLPWTITVPISAGINVTMSASGTATNGSLNISYDGTSGGSTIHASDYCSQESN